MQFDTDTERFIELADRGSKHMAQGREAKRRLADRRVGSWVRMHPSNGWVWAKFPDGKVRAAKRMIRDFDAELDHPIV